MDRKQIASVLTEMSVLLELAGANPFKSRAFSNGAHAIEALDEDLSSIVEEDRLLEIDGIGKTIARGIAELVRTGTFEDYEKLKQEVPEGLLEIRKLPGLGSKKVRLLWDSLGITTIDELEAAVSEGKLEGVAGFGPKSTANILDAIGRQRERAGRVLWPVARAVAERFETDLADHPAVGRFAVAGSLRRRAETVHDVDLLASAAPTDREVVMREFVEHPDVGRILVRGDTKSSITTSDGVQVDLRVVSDDEFPFALHHFTGSKEHNTALRGRAKARGLKMSEWGIFEGERRLDAEDEEQVFAHLDLPWIPPELRENQGEIEAAEVGDLPELVTTTDLRGALHMHTTASDGHDSLERMVEAARERKWQYVGISDHSASAIYANGLDVAAVRAQHREIDTLQRRIGELTIFKGIESDILENGSLDYDDEVLAEFDFVIASVHSRFGLDRAAMTERILTAVRHPSVTVLGHPTGRRLLAREPYDVDLDRILVEAGRLDVSVELNASPHRLDLDWRHCRRAVTEGVSISIGPDAHRAEGLDLIEIGVGIARKGWLTKKDVLNCRTAKQMRAVFGARRRKWKPVPGARSRYGENGEILA